MFLFLLCFSKKYISVDIGSQYTKCAISSLDGNAEIMVNKENKVLTPSAIYIKNRGKKVDGCDIEYMIGDLALKKLKKERKNDELYLPKYIGRSVNITDDLDVTELLSIFIYSILETKLNDIEGFSITLPDHFTLSQRISILKAASYLNLPLISIIDSSSSIIQLYSINCRKKIIYGVKNILFIDLGASGIRSFRVEFEMNNSIPIAHQTSYEYSEKTGGLVFIKKIADYYNISFSKAKRLLMNTDNDFYEILSEDLDEIDKIIMSAIDNEIDEVQLVGGASRIPFIVDYIQKVVGYIDIKKDLPQMDSVALGSLHLLLSSLNESRYEMTRVKRTPIYSSYCKCGETKVNCCKHGKKCKDFVIFPNLNCSKIEIFANEDEVPLGVSNIIASYDLKDKPKGKFNGLVFLRPPLPIIENVALCKQNSRDCISINVEPSKITGKSNYNEENIVKMIIHTQKENIKKFELKENLKIAINNIKKQSKISNIKLNECIVKAEGIISGENETTSDSLAKLLKEIESFSNYEFVL